MKVWQRHGLWLGLLAFAVMRAAPSPGRLSDSAWAIAALTVLMAIWWLTEALPLAATALLPVVLVPLLGVSPIDAVAPRYAHPLIMLFLGGFVIARALERWDLHRRIAALVLRISPRGPGGLIGALMAATAFLSMWISNTATAMLMVPIAQSISRAVMHSIGQPPARTPTQPVSRPVTGRAASVDQFAAALTLAVAFAATVGGMASLIGTPPNALLAGYLESSHGLIIGFGRWMLLGLPIAICLLCVTWFVLTRLAFTFHRSNDLPVGEILDDIQGDLRPMSSGARLTALIASVTGLMLLLRPALQAWYPSIALSDAAIAMTGAVVMFAMPSFGDDRGRLIDWDHVQTIRWDVLVLFGGGLALAAAIQTSGLAQAIGTSFTALNEWPIAFVILVAMVMIVYLGELASNTAMAAVFLPVAGAAAAALGASPVQLLLPIGLAASLGFMLPVATPPNAIAFGSGAVSSGQMIRAGAILDVISIPIVYLIATTIGPWVVSV